MNERRPVPKPVGEALATPGPPPATAGDTVAAQTERGQPHPQRHPHSGRGGVCVMGPGSSAGSTTGRSNCFAEVMASQEQPLGRHTRGAPEGAESLGPCQPSPTREEARHRLKPLRRLWARTSPPR